MSSQSADLLEIASALDAGSAAFTICRLADGVALTGPAFDGVAAYCVLAGSMHLELPGICTHILRTDSIALIPAGLAPVISSGAPVQGAALDGRSIISRGGPWLVADATQGRVSKVTAAAARIAGTTGSGLSQVTIVSLGRDRMGRKLSAMLRGEVSDPGVANGALAVALMTGCIVIALRNAAVEVARGAPADRSRTPHRMIDRAVAVVRADPGGGHSVDTLSDIAGMSSATFRRQFARVMRMSPMQFVLQTRLNAAAVILRSGVQSVKAVAAHTGFASRSHFSRAFRKAFGSDPSSFRQENNDIVEKG